MRVLLIEDSHADAVLFQHNFKEHYPDATVEHVCTAKEGLYRAEQGRYNIILVDLHLPDSSPLDTIKTFDNLESKYFSPVVFMSGITPLQTKIEVLKKVMLFDPKEAGESLAKAIENAELKNLLALSIVFREFDRCLGEFENRFRKAG